MENTPKTHRIDNDIYLDETMKMANVGDFISIEPNNQMGIKQYKVIENKKGRKALKLISDYYSDMNNYGGKGKTKRNKRTIKRSKKRTNKKRNSKRNRKSKN